MGMILAPSEAGSRKPSRRLLALTSSIRCHRSSAGLPQKFTFQHDAMMRPLRGVRSWQMIIRSEALAEATRAHQLDPLSPIVSGTTAKVYISARRYDEAIAWGKKLANDNQI